MPTRPPAHRPPTVLCAVCGAPVPVNKTGAIPKYCAEHRGKGHGRTVNTPVGTYDMAVRITELRLAVELVKPLLRMALMRPDRAQDLVARALGHLEDTGSHAWT